MDSTYIKLDNDGICLHILKFFGSVVTQVFSRRPLALAAKFWSNTSPSGIYGRHTGTGTDVSRGTRSQVRRHSTNLTDSFIRHRPYVTLTIDIVAK